MKAVVKTLYFSPKTDTDLIAVYYQIGAKNFAKAIKESLRMTIRPGYISEFISKLSLDPTFDMPIKNALSMNISFCAEGDEDIRILLSKTKPKKMTYFMKMALRYAIGPYFILGFCLQGDNTLTKAYQRKELFFIEGLRERISTKYIEKKVSEEPKNIPHKNSVMNLKDETKEESVKEIIYIPKEEPIVTETDDFDDEDILQMLLEM